MTRNSRKLFSPKLFGLRFAEILCLAVCLRLLFAPVASAEVPPLHFYTLDNGLRVILSANNNLPVVNQTLWYIVGSQDEPHGQSGLAHILEHLMFKGTERYPDGAFSKIISDVGGRENATTSRYYTNYYQTVASEHWPRMAELEADRMTNLQFNSAETRTEIDVAYEERLTRVENNPHAILSEQVLGVLYGNHPYGRPVIGFAHELLSHKDNEQAISDFYRRYYVPQNAILTVSGDIDIASAKRVIAETYGKIPRGTAVENTAVLEPPKPARGHLRQEIAYSHADVTQEFLSFNMVVPSVGYNNESDSRIGSKASDILPLLIIADVLNSPNFTLHDDLVRKSNEALGVSVYYAPLGRGPGSFALYLAPSEGKKLTTLQKKLQDKLRAIADEGFSEAQVKAAKLRITDSVLLSYDSLSGFANLAAQAMISGLTFDEFLSWQDRLRATSTDEINAVLKHYFGGRELQGVWAFLQKEEQ